MPYANAWGEGRGATSCDAASGSAEGGGGCDGINGRASRSASATAASPPEGPGWISTSPARGSKSKLKASCSGTRWLRNAATSGGTWGRFGCT
eukprot:1972799-Pleurochrysis_carterae.AAC.1